MYDENNSIREIASALNTYPNKIARILKKAGKELRSKREAGKIAVDQGKIKPPMLGKKRSEEEKSNIAAKRSKKWKEMSEEDLEAFRKNAKDRWESQTEQEKDYRQQKAGEALKKASVEGSKAEKYLYRELTKAGYDVIMHKTGLIPGEKYEIDLYIPSMMVAIEIDGPQHFFPIYGEKNLNRNIKYDSIKNGALISRGICVLRIKYLHKHNSRTINKKLFSLILGELNKIKNKFPDLQNRLIELEMDDV